MFGNDLSGQYGTQWNVPSFWGTQNPYFYGIGTVPQNFYGFGNPYLGNVGTQQTGWNFGQTTPQTTSYPFPNYNWGFNHNTQPYNYMYSSQGYNPYMYSTQGYNPYFQNFQNFQNPFQSCR